MDSNAIEVDPALMGDDLDEYIHDGCATSLSSSVTEYFFENGRRYHSYFGTDKNLMPTDEKEQDRLDLHHEAMLMLLDNALHEAPIPAHPQRILDIGTGTGIWAIDMATLYPDAEVIGTDLSPIQPGWVPPNCRFEVDDAEKGLPYDDDHFDFVHARNLAQAITDWPHVLAEAFRCTKPGGYVELAEMGSTLFSDDDTLTVDNALVKVLTHLNTAMSLIGRPHPDEPPTLATRLRAAGFEGVQELTLKEPLGPWPKDPKLKQIGAMALLCCDSGVEAYAMAAMTRILGIEPAEAARMCTDALKALKMKGMHAYNQFHIAYGQKPGRAVERGKAGMRVDICTVASS